MEIRKDVLIIGGGVAGINAGVYLSRSNLSFCIVEASMLGGKLNTITKIENYPGYQVLSGLELIKNLKGQMEKLGFSTIQDRIINLKKLGENEFEAKGEKNLYRAKAVIIATGLENKKNGIPGEKEYFGKGISYCAVCDAFFNRGKDVVVFANDSKGYKEALHLESVVNKLYLISDKNRDDLEGNLAKLRASEKVTFMYPYKIIKFVGDKNVITGVMIGNTRSGKVRTVNCFSVFPYFGETPSSYFLTSLNLASKNGFILVDENCSTSVKGIFAAGDIVLKPLKQIVTAQSDGAIAACAAIRYVGNK